MVSKVIYISLYLEAYYVVTKLLSLADKHLSKKIFKVKSIHKSIRYEKTLFLMECHFYWDHFNNLVLLATKTTTINSPGTKI